MKKIFLLASAALLTTFALTSCVEDKVYDGPETKVVDYTKLRLNEINGTGEDAAKYIEIINTGSKTIELNGVEVLYGADVTWTGANQTIAANAYLVLQGTKGTGDMSKGLSAGKNITVTMKNPTGQLIDTFQRGDGSESTATPNDKSYSRIPDGTGDWYLTDAAGTKGVTNGTSTDGLTLVNADAAPDVKLNELDGNNKFIEFYNNGNAPANLEGYKMYKDESTITAETAPIWIGQAGMTLAAGAYLALDGVKGSTSYATEFGSGLSAAKTLIVILVDASGNEVDRFTRGTEGSGWGISLANNSDTDSFSRVPDGTGEWAYAAPTKAAANGAKTGDIEME